MTVEIISVGTELLLGNIVNTNTAYLAQKCAGLGLSCYYQVVVGDDEERLADTIKQAYNRSDIIILGGGLGPTKDDLTKETVAGVFDIKLIEDEVSAENIKEYHRRYNISDIPQSNRKQALVFENGIVVKNNNGTAPGLIYEKDGKHIILMPGPPGEMIPMFEQDIEPYLRKLSRRVVCSKMVKIAGVGKSKAAEVIEDVTLEEAVYRLLCEKKLTITTAESCTGGLIGAALVNVAGVSSVYREGYITYSNEAKHKLLGVSEETLLKYGAVSEETAREMADGAVKAAGADVSIAVTGIAGPDGGTETKPVGLVYMACHYNGKTIVEKHNLNGNRSKVRENTVVRALDLVRRTIVK